MAEYQSVSLRDDLREEMKEIIDEEDQPDTYSDLVGSLLADREGHREDVGVIRKQVEYNSKLLQQQAALLTRLVQSMNPPEGTIPDEFEEIAQRSDPTDPFSLPQEVVDDIEEEDQE